VGDRDLVAAAHGAAVGRWKKGRVP
jgi:hypothetical protein